MRFLSPLSAPDTLSLPETATEGSILSFNNDLYCFLNGTWLALNNNATVVSDVTGLATALDGKQPLADTLTALSSLSWVSGTQVVVFTATDTVSFKTVGTAAGNILDKASGDTLYTPVAHATSSITSSGHTMATGRLLGRTTASTGSIEEITAASTLSLSGGILGVVAVPNSVTFDNGGAGAGSGTAFDGSVAQTISYNTIGAAPTSSPTFSGTATIASLIEPQLIFSSAGVGNFAKASLIFADGSAVQYGYLGNNNNTNTDFYIQSGVSNLVLGSVTGGAVKLNHQGTDRLVTSGTGVSVTGTLSATGAVSGSNLSGTNTGDQTITLTGDITGSGTGSFATAIGANKVTRGMLAAATGATILGATAAGNIADLTAAQAKTFLAIAAGDVSGLATVATTGAYSDLSGKPSLATIATTGSGADLTANSVSLGKLAAQATATFLANNSGSSAAPSAITAASATAMLTAMVGDSGSGGTKGLVPAPATGDASKFLKGDGTWTAISSSSGTTTNAVTFNNSGTGVASGTTFDGSAARTISYNTLGAAPTASPTFTGTVAAASVNSATGVALQYNGTTKLTTTTAGIKLGGGDNPTIAFFDANNAQRATIIGPSVIDSSLIVQTDRFQIKDAAGSNQYANITSTSWSLLTGNTSRLSINNTAVHSFLDINVDGRVNSANLMAVKVASTSNFANTGTADPLRADTNGATVFDGVTLVAGDYVLLKDQTLPEQNGVYVVSIVGTASIPTILARATSVNTWANISSGTMVSVIGGTTQTHTMWLCTADAGGTLGTTAINFKKIPTATDTFTSTATGVVPSSGGGTANFLRADGTWAAPPTTAPAWGEITGTLSDQTDLQSVLDAKADSADLSSYATSSSVTTGLAAKEDAITAGTTGQYWRGDKSWQTLDKTAVGLANVDNTTDASKPVSTATQTALDAKANLTGATFSGSISATNLSGTNTGDQDLSGLQPKDDDLTAIAALAGTSGLLKKTAANTWSLDTTSYLTANQAVTLSGDISGSGTTAITTTIGAGKVTRAMMANTSAATILGSTAAGAVAELTASQGRTVLGLATVASTGAYTDLSGTPSLAASATTDTTNASNISTGTLSTARLPVQGFGIGVSGKSTNSAKYPAVAPYAFTATTGNSSAIAGTAATASTVYTLKKNGTTTVGTFTFAAAGTTATVSITAGSISAGDFLTLEAPATADTTLADIAFLIRA